MSVWGLLGSAESREPWETFLSSKGITSIAIDRAPLHSLHELALCLVVDTDVDSHVVEKLWLFEGHMDVQAPVIANLAACSGTKLAALCKHPERVCAFAMMPPLGEFNIEFAVTDATSEDAARRAKASLEQLGLTIETIGDRAGGVVPRTIAMLVNEAGFALQDGLASETEIDTAMKLGVNHPLGPFEWSRKIGVKYISDVLKGIYRETGDSRYRKSVKLR